MSKWEQILRWVALSVVLTGVAVLFGLTLAPHNVDYYYVSHAGSSGPMICAEAHWTWHPDEQAYCSDDVNKVLDFIQKADAILPRHP